MNTRNTDMGWSMEEICSYYIQTEYSDVKNITLVLESVEDAIWIDNFFNIGSIPQVYRDYISWAENKLKNIV